MKRKLFAAALAAVAGLSATTAFAGNYGSASATDARDEVKVSPAGRATVYTHIPARPATPYALTGQENKPVRVNEIRVGSRVVAVQPVYDAR
ncbi:MAG TPA: hypothetical protein VF796_00380 [Humisphaera sp.]